MRSPQSRLRATNRSTPSDSSERGLTLVELMVTVVIAGIVFAAMVPVFANALQRTSDDGFRVTATNIAQDRIEKIRQLATLLHYGDITTANLNSSTFANGQFGTTFTPSTSTKQYNIAYTVDTQSNYKNVSVTVTWQGSAPNYKTVMNTIVMDPNAAYSYATNNPVSAGPFNLTVAFKNWTEVSKSSGAGGVSVAQVYTRPGTPSPVPTRTVIVSPTMWPSSAATPTVTWTNLPGGGSIIYRVTCKSTKFTSTAPDFHLLSNGWMKFDTNPGGS